MNPVTEGQLGLAHAPKQILGEARHTQEHGLQDFMPLLGRRKNRGLRSDGHGTTNLAANPRPTQRRVFALQGDRKSTRLNSSHQIISYAVFCLKKKTKTHTSK